MTAPTNPQQPEPRSTKAVIAALTLLRTRQLNARTPSGHEQALTEFIEAMRELFTPIKIIPVGQRPEDDELNKIIVSICSDPNGKCNYIQLCAPCLDARQRLIAWADRRADKRVEEALAERDRLWEHHVSAEVIKRGHHGNCMACGNDRVEEARKQALEQAWICCKPGSVAWTKIGDLITASATHHPKGGE